MKHWWLVKYISLSALLMGGGYFGYYTLKKDTLPAVRTETVKQGDVIQRVTFTGMIIPKRKSIITAPYNGYIRKIFVGIGSIVKEGQPLLTLSQEPGKQINEQLYPLRAPFSGKIVQVFKREGEFVGTQGGPDQMIMRLDDLSNLLVTADVPEMDYAKLKLNQSVIIKAVAVPQKEYHGRIMQISLSSKEQDRWERSRVEFPLQVEFLDEDEFIKPGMSAIIDVIVNQSTDVLTLRHEFIEKNGEKYYVTNDKGEHIEIKVGMQDEDSFEIKEGLKLGEKVRQVDFLKGTTKI